MFLLLRKDDALLLLRLLQRFSLPASVKSEPPAWENGFLRAVLLCELYSLE